MDELTVARAVHVIAVVAWIGGVYFVTLVLLPAIRDLAEPAEQIRHFEDIEGRFGLQAKIMTLAAGASGFYMLYVLDGWGRYADPAYWWVHAMTLIWALFTIVLFVLEPLVLHAWFRRRAEASPESTFVLLSRFHQILLAASLITVFGAVLGAHG